MSYIVGTSFGREKNIFFSLPYIYGVGYTQSKILCRKLGLGLDCRFVDISLEDIKLLENYIEALSDLWGQDLRRFRQERVLRLYSISCYRGLRHRKGLPVRGQRTHTNSKRRVAI